MKYLTLFFLALLGSIFCSSAKAQFYTIKKDNTPTIREVISEKQPEEINRNITQQEEANEELPLTEVDIREIREEKKAYRKARERHQVKKYNNTRRKEPKGVSMLPENAIKEENQRDIANLPELTVPNLIREINKQELQHPEIVLAQAILETGWFTSPVCKKKNNLFGLTNPRTKQYYEFTHWTESVKAYYTKVQYRYKGGNYLYWLRDIGYAEAPNYIQSLTRVIKTLRKL